FLDDTGIIGKAISIPLRLLGLGNEKSVQEELQQFNPDADGFQKLSAAFADPIRLKAAILGASRTFSSTTIGWLDIPGIGQIDIPGIGQIDIVSGNIADTISSDVTKNAFAGVTDPTMLGNIKAFQGVYGDAMHREVKAELQSLAKSKTTISIKGAGRTTSITTEEIAKAVEAARLRVDKDETVLRQFYSVRNGVSVDAIKAAKLGNETVDAVAGEMNLQGKITRRFGETITVNTVDAAGNQLTDAQITAAIQGNAKYAQVTALENDVRREVLNRITTSIDAPSTPLSFADKILGTPVAGAAPGTRAGGIALNYSLVDGQTTFNPTGTRQPRIVPTKTLKITDEDIKAMVAEGERIFKEDALERITSGDTGDYAKALQKKFASTGVKNLAVNAAQAVEDARPKFWSVKGGLAFAKNALKEGTLGALANGIGLIAYNSVLNREDSAGINAVKTISREEELKKAQVGLFGQEIETTGNAAKEIVKYNTYLVSLKTRADGAQSLTFSQATSGIPPNTKQELVLNDCKNSGIDRELGEVLPGLIPEVENSQKFPEPFKASKELQTQHVKIAKNYLAEQ
ncbi:MAG: hypothetical protein AABW99_00130, partial [archaeon]